MKSGLRGGKPRDMATFKHGGTSRGAGAAKKGFDYAVYKKGGKVKKYADGGAIRDNTGEYVRDPLTGTRQYASFGDLMGDLFGKKKVPASAKVEERKAKSSEDTGTPDSRESISGVPTLQGVDTAPAPRPRAPQRARPQDAQSRRMNARRQQDFATMDRDVAEGGGRDFPRLARERRAREASAMNMGDDPALNRETLARYRQALGLGDDPILASALTRESAARARQAASGLYAKGGKVKMAGGGSCRGMGAAQRGGKYTIK